MTFNGVWAALKGLSWVGKLGGVAAVPVLGPILSLIVGLLQLLWRLIVYVIKGCGNIVRDPASAVALVVIGAILFVFGLKYGIAFDAHLVKVARAETEAKKTELANLEAQLETAHHVDDTKARAAIEERERAKAAAIVPSVEVVTSVPPPVRKPADGGVRGKGNGSNKKDSRSDLERLLGF